jgi:hypothetical protein
MSDMETIQEAANQQEAREAFGEALRTSAHGDMSDLLDKLHEGDLAETVEAWAEGEDHEPLTAEQIKGALGEERVEQLAASLGMPEEQLLEDLVQHLPELAKAHIALEAADDSDEHEPEADDDHDAEEGEDEHHEAEVQAEAHEPETSAA